MAKPIGYSGYYPGEKIPRAPSGRPAPYIPNEYDLNVFADSINDMHFNFGDAPGFVQEQLDKAIKFQFSANLYSSGLEAEDLQSYAEEELAEERSELAGTAGFSLNLDPRDILKDPQKWWSKIPKQVYADLTNIGDLEQKYIEQLWGDTLGLTVLQNGRRYADYEVVEALQATEIFTTAREVLPGGRSALAIAGLTILDTKGDEKKLGKKTAAKIADFEGNIKSVFNRPKKYDEVIQTIGEEGSMAIKTAITRGGTKWSATPGLTGTQIHEGMAFVGMTEFASSIGKVSKQAGLGKKGSGLSAVIAKLNEEETSLDLGKSIAETKKELEKARTHMRLLTEGFDQLSDAQKQLLDKDTMEFYQKYLPTGPVLSKSYQKALQPHFKRFEASLSKLENALGGKVPTNFVERQLLLNQVTVAITDLTLGSYLQPCLERAVLKRIAEDFVLGRGGTSPVQLAKLEELFPHGSAEHTYFRNLRVMLPTIIKDRDYYDMSDFTDVLYKNSVLSTFLWMPKIVPRLKAFTPDYYVGVFMKRMHMMGLVIDESMLFDAHGNPVNPKFFLFKWANKLVTHEGNKLFLNSWGMMVNGKKMVVAGGKHFEVIEDAWMLFEENKQLLIDILNNPADVQKILAKFMASQKMQKSPWFLKNFKGKSNTEIKEWIENFSKKFEKFHKWLKDKADKLGVDITDGTQVLALIAALKKRALNKVATMGKALGITTQYRGGLQWFVQKLSIVQDKIFKGALGKVAARLIGWKTAASHAISAAIITALSSTGIGAISGIFEKSIQFVVRILLDTAEKAFMVVFKADFAEFSKFMEKSMVNLLKWFAYAMGAIGMVAALCMLPAMVVIGAFSSQDNSKIGPIGSGGGTGAPGVPGTPAPYLPPAEPGGCFFETGGYLSYPSFGFVSRSTYEIGSSAYDRVGHGGIPYSTCINAAGERYPCLCIKNPWKLGASWSWEGCIHCATSSSQSCDPCLPLSEESAPASTHYGFAADFKSSTEGNIAPVRLPTLGAPNSDEAGEPIWIWDVLATDVLDVGGWATFTRTDPEDMTMYILHILHFDRSQALINAAEDPNAFMLAGDHIGNLFQGGFSPHVHIELMVNFEVVRPDDYFCVNDAGPYR